MKIDDKMRVDWLQSLCPKKNKTSYDFNIAWTAYGYELGRHVSVRGRGDTFFRKSIRAAIDAAIRSEQARAGKAGRGEP